MAIPEQSKYFPLVEAALEEDQQQRQYETWAGYAALCLNP